MPRGTLLGIRGGVACCRQRLPLVTEWEGSPLKCDPKGSLMGGGGAINLRMNMSAGVGAGEQKTLSKWDAHACVAVSDLHARLGSGEDDNRQIIPCVLNKNMVINKPINHNKDTIKICALRGFKLKER